MILAKMSMILAKIVSHYKNRLKIYYFLPFILEAKKLSMILKNTLAKSVSHFKFFFMYSSPLFRKQTNFF